MTDLRRIHLDDLILTAPMCENVEQLHAIYSNPRVWTHFPSARFTKVSETESMLNSWIQAWDQDGLGPWMVRGREDEEALLGNGGCSLRGGGQFWNLGYRFAPEAQGRGYATLVANKAIEVAHGVKPEIPVVAYLLEHNTASARVASKVGLTLVHRAPDDGNPDLDAIRLIYADRPLTDAQLAATLH